MEDYAVLILNRSSGIIRGLLLAAMFFLCAAPAAAELVVDGDVVTDTDTGLVWKKADEVYLFTWKEALKECADLSLAGKSDWRLPNIRELRSIINAENYNPAHNPVFTCVYGCAAKFWSSTTFVDAISLAWYVDFYDGGVSFDAKTVDGGYRARCVRGGPE